MLKLYQVTASSTVYNVTLGTKFALLWPWNFRHVCSGLEKRPIKWRKPHLEKKWKLANKTKQNHVKQPDLFLTHSDQSHFFCFRSVFTVSCRRANRRTLNLDQSHFNKLGGRVRASVDKSSQWFLCAPRLEQICFRSSTKDKSFQCKREIHTIGIINH